MSLSKRGTRSHLCGYDLNLTYPQNGHFPTLNPPGFSGFAQRTASDRTRKTALLRQALKVDSHAAPRSLHKRGSFGTPDPQLAKRNEEWKRELSGRPNGTIDPFYGCDLYDEVIDYAFNFSLPWSEFSMIFDAIRSILTNAFSRGTQPLGRRIRCMTSLEYH